MADRSKIDNLVNEQIKAIDEDHDGWEIERVLCIIEIKAPGGAEVRVRSSDDDLAPAYGLLKLAERGMLNSGEDLQAAVPPSSAEPA